MKKSKLYTGIGDNGMTSFIGGKMVSKASEYIEVYGTIDELNCDIGYLVALLPSGCNIIPDLENVQRVLFLLGDALTFENSNLALVCDKIAYEVNRIEALIDKEDAQLPVLNHFILPGGSQAAAYSHVCRAVCRRLERRLVALTERQQILPSISVYINRLSDYLFVIARKLNFIDSFIEKSTD